MDEKNIILTNDDVEKIKSELSQIAGFIVGMKITIPEHNHHIPNMILDKVDFIFQKLSSK